MKKILLAAALAALVVTLLTPDPATALRQTNPVKKAPSVINNDPSSFHNEYPWFSGDGNLFLWTRQEGDTGTQWLWVAYLKNRQQVLNTAEGATLPDLSFSTPMELEVVNHWVMDNVANAEIKAFAVCEEADPVQPVDLGNRWRYRFTLYMAVGPPGENRAMYRAHRVFVVVNKASQEITKMGISGDFQQVIPPATRPSTGGTANETEPMLTRDGQYLFWASNAFEGSIAKFIGTTTACQQLNQTPTPYDQLPSSRFAWKDQYSTGFTYQRTSRTNYHTVIERPNGTTALIFERCSGQTSCNVTQAGNRECLCAPQDSDLSTTGFAAGGAPTVITSCCGSKGLNSTGARVTHPAISGPRNPGDQSWLLFFMRGKKIWYTKIKE